MAPGVADERPRVDIFLRRVGGRYVLYVLEADGRLSFYSEADPVEGRPPVVIANQLAADDAGTEREVGGVSYVVAEPWIAEFRRGVPYVEGPLPSPPGAPADLRPFLSPDVQEHLDWLDNHPELSPAPQPGQDVPPDKWPARRRLPVSLLVLLALLALVAAAVAAHFLFRR